MQEVLFLDGILNDATRNSKPLPSIFCSSIQYEPLSSNALEILRRAPSMAAVAQRGGSAIAPSVSNAALMSSILAQESTVPHSQSRPTPAVPSHRPNPPPTTTAATVVTPIRALTPSTNTAHPSSSDGDSEGLDDTHPALNSSATDQDCHPLSGIFGATNVPYTNTHGNPRRAS